jgi:hypothetical protein
MIMVVLMDDGCWIEKGGAVVVGVVGSGSETGQ